MFPTHVPIRFRAGPAKMTIGNEYDHPLRVKSLTYLSPCVWQEVGVIGRDVTITASLDGRQLS